jgi:hypothetical protein
LNFLAAERRPHPPRDGAITNYATAVFESVLHCSTRTDSISTIAGKYTEVDPYMEK